jgi:hypothetical protein
VSHRKFDEYLAEKLKEPEEVRLYLEVLWRNTSRMATLRRF